MGAKFKSKTHLLYRFFDFWRRFMRVWLQSLTKVLIWPKEKNLTKLNKVSKNAEFHADFKVFKKCTQQSYQQNKFDEHE